VIYSCLDPYSRVQLFAASHSARRAVLLCASRVSLQLPDDTDSSLSVLGALLEVPAGQCFEALNIEMQTSPGQLLEHIGPLKDGRVQSLHLQVSLNAEGGRRASNLCTCDRSSISVAPPRMACVGEHDQPCRLPAGCSSLQPATQSHVARGMC
jgi:hypothetical protein